MIIRLLAWLLAAFALLAAALAVNTWHKPSRQTAVEPAPPVSVAPKGLVTLVAVIVRFFDVTLLDNVATFTELTLALEQTILPE